MKVRDAVREDHASIMELLVYLNADDCAVDAQDSLDIFQRILTSPHFTLLVIEEDDLVVGTCYLNLIPNLTRGLSPYAIIENVVTHPSVRKKGLGKRLLKAAIDQAFERGCYKVMLLTGRGDGVQEFYKQCGMDGDSKKAFIVRCD